MARSVLQSSLRTQVRAEKQTSITREPDHEAPPLWVLRDTNSGQSDGEERPAIARYRNRSAAATTIGAMWLTGISANKKKPSMSAMAGRFRR